MQTRVIFAIFTGTIAVTTAASDIDVCDASKQIYRDASCCPGSQSTSICASKGFDDEALVVMQMRKLYDPQSSDVTASDFLLGSASSWITERKLHTGVYTGNSKLAHWTEQMVLPDYFGNCPGTISLFMYLTYPSFNGPFYRNGVITAERQAFKDLMDAHSDLYKLEVDMGRDANSDVAFANGFGGPSNCSSLSWYPFPAVNGSGGMCTDAFWTSPHAPPVDLKEQVKAIFTKSWAAIETLAADMSLTTAEANVLRYSQYLTYYHSAILAYAYNTGLEYQESKNGAWVPISRSTVTLFQYQRDNFKSLYPYQTMHGGTDERSSLLYYNVAYPGPTPTAFPGLKVHPKGLFTVWS